jgi:hypothetical protein
VIVSGPLVLSHCNGKSNSEPVDCQPQTVVLANDPQYMALTEALTPAPGKLTKNCDTNARYCYYLGTIPVYTKDDRTSLDGFVNQKVLIVGKIVFSAGGGSGEIWPGTICRLSS